MLNSSINGNLKCGILMMDDTGTVRGIDRPDKSSCISGYCRFCNPFNGGAATNGFNVQCADTNGGRGEARVCLNPGVESAFVNSFWTNALVYNQDPVRVWLAIFFVFVLANTFINVALLVKGSRHGYAAV